MSVTECSLCGRAGDSRSMTACDGCGSPLCSECAKINRFHCRECSLDEMNYEG